MPDAARKLTRRNDQIETQREEIAAHQANEARSRAAGGRARCALTSMTMAIQRQNSALALLDWRHGRQGRRDPDVAAQFAAVIFAGLVWEVSGNRKILAEDRHRIAAKELLVVLPGLPAANAAELAQQPDVRMTNAQAGAALGFAWSEYEALRRNSAILQGKRQAIQLAPCDISAKELQRRRVALNRELDATRKAEKRRKTGRRTADDRAAADAAWREELERLADEHGVTTRTVRRWISTGKLAPSPDCQNAVREKYSNTRADSRMTRSASGSGGAQTPPRQHPSSALLDVDDFDVLEMKRRVGASSPEPAPVSEEQDHPHDLQQKLPGQFSSRLDISQPSVPTFSGDPRPLAMALEISSAGPAIICAVLARAAEADLNRDRVIGGLKAPATPQRRKSA